MTNPINSFSIVALAAALFIMFLLNVPAYSESSTKCVQSTDFKKMTQEQIDDLYGDPTPY